MRELLENTPLSEGTAQAACAILHRIAEAEARVHDAKGRLCAYASTTCMIFRPERGR